MQTRKCLMGAVLALGLATSGAAIAGTANDGVFKITATESQLTTTVPGAVTFAPPSDFAGYSGSLVTPVATFSGGALNPGGSTNPDTGIDSSIANYLAASSGVSETITFNATQKYFGMLWGSVDTSNTVSFFENGAPVASYTGAELESNSVALTPWDAPGSFVDFVADGSGFNQIVLSENTTFFETANYAVAGVPEPTAWAMMLLGVGAIGASMRMARRYSPVGAI